MGASLMDAKKISLLEEIFNEKFESSNFNAFLLDESGNIVVSKLRKGGEEFSEDAMNLLENRKCISDCFKQGEVEDFILRTKEGYIVAVTVHSHILAVSGVTEEDMGEILKRVKAAAETIENMAFSNKK